MVFKADGGQNKDFPAAVIKKCLLSPAHIIQLKPFCCIMLH